jgi:hypothetical protein
MNDAFKNVIKMKNNVDIVIIVQRQNYNRSRELEYYQNSTLTNDRESKLGWLNLTSSRPDLTMLKLWTRETLMI